MAATFVVRDLFRLSGGSTVLACEGQAGEVTLIGRSGELRNGSELRQRIRFDGERTMVNQQRPTSFRAFETSENVQLSVDEAQTGMWVLTLED